MNYMDHPYWVADYLVDPARNQVTRSQKTYLLQPKVLAVLNLLAQNAGKVVSHETLMREVWPDTYVSPNTLQRCIAEVRKALGDNSRTQSVVKTHSKQGYSLEVDVKPDEPVSKPEAQAKHSPFHVALFSVVILVLLGAFFFGFRFNQQDAVRYETITPLTATDAKEFYPDYSPDGRYMVFHRYLGVCENHIWAKDLKTQNEIQLTRDSAVYGQHSWSSDGSQLAFTVQENCAKNKTERSICWQLHTLDFAAAIKTPQPSVERLNCENKRVSRPRWLADGSILMMEHSQPAKIVRYLPSTDQLSDFYTPTENRLTHFDLAQKSGLVAVFEQDRSLRNSWTLLDESAAQVSTNTFTLPQGLSIFQRIEPNFTPDEDRFLLNTSQGLYTLTFAGSILPVDIVRPTRLFTPVADKHNEKILATQGQVDSDIALFRLAKDSQDMSLPKSLARSNSYDANAKFQPGGDSIAFMSKRSGTSQIWMANSSQVIQQSQFPPNTHLSSLHWAPDGSSLVTVTNDKIAILSLDGTLHHIDLHYPVRSVLQWIDKDNLLIEGILNSTYQTIRVNLSDFSSESTGLQDVIFAHLLADNSLFYIDSNQQARLKKDASNLALPELERHLDSKRFLVKNGQLYGINWQGQLWKYNIQDQRLDILATLHEDIWWVSDVVGDQVLFTTLIASPKEIIELSRQP